MRQFISSERMNQFIGFLNNGKTKDELNPPIQNEREDEMFDKMAAELRELKKKNPDAEFLPVESDW